MAQRRRPQVKKIKFELTRSSIAGIGIVLFCIFLWMFLFGVWTGQSLLLPTARPEKVMAAKVESSPEQVKSPVRIEAGRVKRVVAD